MIVPTPHATEEPEAPRDLRAELFENLSTHFGATLEANGSLPIAAQQALVELLDLDAPTAAQIIAAASKDEPDEEEVPNE
ncbi:MAG: hypothetical protein ACSHYF_13805 [Verrucomicrobiaceae bacterium]